MMINLHKIVISLLSFVSALLGKNTTSEISLFYPIRYDYLINITRRNAFCWHFWHFGWHFIQLSIFSCLQ